MVERLVQALQHLADSHEIGTPANAPGDCADWLAQEFDDALRLVSDCPQLELEPAQRDSLSRVEEFLSTRSAELRPEFWRAGAIASGAEWRELRQLAREALAGLHGPRSSTPPRT